MRALVVQEPNVFSIEDVERPAPGPHEVLCKVRAIAICGTCLLYTSDAADE